MGHIKSAWELAMERSEGLTVDTKELRRKESFQKGRAFGLRSLENGTAWAESEKKSHWENLDTEKQPFQEGFVDALLAAYQLGVGLTAFTPPPAEELYRLLLKKNPGNKFSQLTQLVQQFGEELDHLKVAITQQIGPKLQQRAEQKARQAGVSVQYALERDPEFIKIFNQNLEAIRSKYQNYMDRLKEEIRDISPK